MNFDGKYNSPLVSQDKIRHFEGRIYHICQKPLTMGFFHAPSFIKHFHPVLCTCSCQNMFLVLNIPLLSGNSLEGIACSNI